MESVVNVVKGKQLYEGKAKIIYATDKPDLYIQYFKDDATAFNAQKKGTIGQKGICNNKISTCFFELLQTKGIDTHFVKMLSEREMLVKRLDIVQVEVTIRNIVAGGMAKLLGLEEGIELKEPVLEYHYKHDGLGDPLINEYHIKALDLATDEEMHYIRERSFEINNILKNFLVDRALILVDFKLEFGRDAKKKIVLGDEISPDTCRFWDRETRKKLDKDRFRRDLGGIEDAYQEVLMRITGKK
ncbi:MAG: phosphoribosylaminoimidazolesuccinocarboxamide synthase [Candidatus Omnitrophica bacterium]|nr:phosphoribosylaminoimidazolesuccinocarboxamide synthase [Candidatus Omnitrophota bacterium]